MVELIEQSKMAVDELIDALGRAQIEAVLRISAAGMAGPPHPRKKGGAIGWHGRERGTICPKERKLLIERPRLRKKGCSEDGEVPVEITCSQVETDDGEMVLGVVRDVTTRKQAKDALCHSEERLRSIVETVKDYAVFTLVPKTAAWSTHVEPPHKILSSLNRDALGGRAVLTSSVVMRHQVQLHDAHYIVHTSHGRPIN